MMCNYVTCIKCNCSNSKGAVSQLKWRKWVHKWTNGFIRDLWDGRDKKLVPRLSVIIITLYFFHSKIDICMDLHVTLLGSASRSTDMSVVTRSITPSWLTLHRRKLSSMYFYHYIFIKENSLWVVSNIIVWTSSLLPSSFLGKIHFRLANKTEIHCVNMNQN